MKFYTIRYKIFGVNVQAMCDSQRRFTMLSIRVGAAVHDSKAARDLWCFISIIDLVHLNDELVDNNIFFLTSILCANYR